MLVAGIYKGADINDKLTVSSPDELLDELEEEDVLLDVELDELMLEELEEIEDELLLDEFEELLDDELELEELTLLELELLEIELLVVDTLDEVSLLVSLELLSLDWTLLKESLDELTLKLDELVAGVQEAMISANNAGTILLNFIWGNNILVK